MPLGDYVNRLKRLLPGVESSLPEGSLDEAVLDAVQFYSRLRPRLRWVTYVGDGQTYEFSLPPDWDAELSRIVSLEYPSGGQNPTLMTPRDYSVSLGSGDVYRLRLLTFVPQGSVAVVYTTGHVLNESQDTLPPSDRQAVCHLAASLAARALSARYASTEDDVLVGNTISYRSKSSDYERLARTYQDMFSAHMGMHPDDLVPSAASMYHMDMDSLHSAIGHDPLMHEG